MKIILFCASLLITSCFTTAKFQKEQAVIVNGASGFYLADGIITANHVADGTFVLVQDVYHEFTGIVVARDTLNDLCFIKYENPKFWDFTISSVNTRDKVYSVGNPARLYYSEISGEVQSVDREEDGQWRIQIGIDVYFGSSGSAVYNSSGNLVGMISKAIPGTRFAFIIPSNQIFLFVKHLK